MTYNQPQFAYPQRSPKGTSDPDDMTLPLYGASFTQSVKRFFKGYVKFDGRASRSEYWWAMLFTTLVSTVPTLILGIILWVTMWSAVWELSYELSDGYRYDSYSYNFPDVDVFAGPIVLVSILMIVFGLVSLALIVPSFAISWRRLHDANQPGPLALLQLVGGWVMTIIIGVLESKVEGEKYDPGYVPQYTYPAGAAPQPGQPGQPQQYAAPQTAAPVAGQAVPQQGTEGTSTPPAAPQQ